MNRPGTRLVVAQVIGQACLLLAVPVYSRFVNVAEVGTFQIATAVAILLQPFATLRLEFNIPAAVRSSTARARARLGYLTAAGVAGFGLVVAACGALLKSESVFTVSISAALLLLGYAWTVIDNALLIRAGNTSSLAVRNLLAGLVAAVLQVIAALFVPSALTLAAAVLIGRLAAILMTSRGVRRGRGTPPEEPSKAEEVVFSWRGSAFSVGAGVVASGAMQALLLVTGALFGQVGAAQLGMAQRITNTPTSLVAQALGQVFAGHSASIVRRREPRLFDYTRRWALRLAAAATIMGVLIGVLGPRLAVPILGEEWSLAGILVAVLAAPLALVLIVTPMMPLMVMMGREDWLFRLNVSRLGVILLVTTVIGLATDDIILTSIATAVVWTGAYTSSVITLLRAAKRWDAHARTLPWARDAGDTDALA